MKVPAAAEQDLKADDDRPFGMGCPFGHGVPVAPANPGPHGEGANRRQDPFVPLDPVDMMRDKSKEFYVKSARHGRGNRRRPRRDLEEGTWLYNVGRLMMRAPLQGKPPKPDEGPKIWKILCVWSFFMFILVLIPLLYILLSTLPEDLDEDNMIKWNSSANATKEDMVAGMHEKHMEVAFVSLDEATPSESYDEQGPVYYPVDLLGEGSIDEPRPVALKIAGVMKGLAIMITAIVFGVVALCTICLCLACWKIRSWQRASRRSSMAMQGAPSAPTAIGPHDEQGVVYYPPQQQIQYPQQPQQEVVVYHPHQSYPQPVPVQPQHQQSYPAPNYPQVHEPSAGRPGRIGFEGLQ